MRSLLLLALCAALAAPLAAQNSRTSVQIDNNTDFIFDPAVASGGDLSAAAWVEDNACYVAVSDGTGKSWGAPVRVDGDGTGARKDMKASSVAVSGDNVFVLWEDRRTTTSRELFFNRSTDGGATYLGEVAIDKGEVFGTGEMRDWTMRVDGDRIYILSSVDVGASGMDEELYLINSQNAGASFSAAVYVPGIVGQTADVDAIGMAVQGLIVHIAYADDRAGDSSFDDVFYCRSSDGGATFGVQDLQLDTSGALVGDQEAGAEVELGVAADGLLVAVSWESELSDLANEEVRVAVSTNGGTSFNADVMVGGYSTATDDADNAVLAINDGNVIVAWEDNRTGSDEIYVATSADNGATFFETQLSTTGGGFPAIAGPGDGGDYLAIGWTGGTFPESAFGSISLDGGATFPAGSAYSTTTGDADFNRISFNGLYDNLVSVWLTDDVGGFNNVFAGGYRSQTVTLNGVPAAGNNISFDATGFGASENGYVFRVLVSGSTGSVTLPGDSRNTCLGLDNILMKSSSKSSLVGNIDVNGNGGTPTSAVPPTSTLPIGTMLSIIAVTRSGGVYQSITDVVSVTVQ